VIRYLLRRVLQAVPLLLGITFISFAVMHLAPGDYLTSMRMNPQIRPETIERLRHNFGLDRPWYLQYLLWLRNAVVGNFGYSFSYKVPVFSLIGQYVFATLLLSVAALLVSWLIAIPLGIYAATHRNGSLDRLASVLAFAGVSLPGFFVALLALLFAQRTGWLPVGGMQSASYSSLSPLGKALDLGRHLVLPALVLGTREVAFLMRQMRGNLLDVLAENFIMAARARGLAERWVIVKHAVRNAINPLVTIFGYEIAGLLSGAALVEVVMDWPGLGWLLLSAVQNRDLYVAMGSFTMGALLLILGNLLADLMLALTDPRIRFSQ
jgi:peptide/nickel transport system permease protein